MKLSDIPPQRPASNERSPNRKPRWRGPLLEATLEAKKQQALDLLGAGDPTALVTERLGLKKQTLASWKQRDPEFRAACREAVQQAREAARGGLAGLLPRIVERAGEAIEAEDALEVMQRVGIPLLRGMRVLEDGSVVETRGTLTLQDGRDPRLRGYTDAELEEIEGKLSEIESRRLDGDPNATA